MTDDGQRRRRLGPRHRTEVTREHVGQRVTIRHRVVEHGEDVVSDVVGHLRAWDDDGLLVERRDGSTVRVAPDAILASRVIPHPPPPRRRPRSG